MAREFWGGGTTCSWESVTFSGSAGAGPASRVGESLLLARLGLGGVAGSSSETRLSGATMPEDMAILGWTEM